MKLVSIIIPVYNAEKTIEYCIKSVLQQTSQNIEIVIVNDGSRDKSQEILENLKRKYPEKLRVYEQKNAGVAITRNKGIEYAKREYILFVDIDDYIEKDLVETLVKKIESKDFMMVIVGYKRVRGFKGNKMYGYPNWDMGLLPSK